MKATLSKDPITAFELPAGAPAAVTKAAASFDRIANQWAAAKGEIADLEQEAAQAEADGIRAAADAHLAGKKPGNPDEKAREVRTKIERKQAELAALTIAVDEAGNELAAMIGNHKRDWIEAIRPAADEAARRYQQELTNARQAAADFAAARSALQWLQDFRPSEARAGQAGQYPRGRPRIPAEQQPRIRDAHDALELLMVAGQLTAQPKQQKARAAA